MTTLHLDAFKKGGKGRKKKGKEEESKKRDLSLEIRAPRYLLCLSKLRSNMRGAAEKGGKEQGQSNEFKTTRNEIHQEPQP